MKKFLLTMAMVLLATTVQAATITLTWTRNNTPTRPATHFRVEERVSGVWGNVTGLPNALVLPASTLTHTINNRSAGQSYSFRIIPMLSGVDGTPSNVCATPILSPDDEVSLTCGVTP